MRLRELTYKIVDERQSGARRSPHLKRFSSEVGLIFGLIGDPSREFDPLNPELSMDKSSLTDPETLFNNIKNSANLYDPDIFYSWAANALGIKTAISSKQSFPNKIGWVSTESDRENPADIKFGDGPSEGISVKDGGTHSNLSPSAYGFSNRERGIDFYRQYGGTEAYDNWKRKIFQIVLSKAKSVHPQKFVPSSGFPDEYILYHPDTDSYDCVGQSGKTFSGTEDKILSKINPNAAWQTPFGVWLTQNFNETRSISSELFNNVAKEVIKTIKNHLSNKENILHLCRFANKSHYFVSPKGVFYVPGKNESSDIIVKNVEYIGSGENEINGNDTISQGFIIWIGFKNSQTAARAKLYISYGRAFGSNPAFRFFLSPKDMENLGWEQLTDGLTSSPARRPTISKSNNTQTTNQGNSDSDKITNKTSTSDPVRVQQKQVTGSSQDILKTKLADPNHPITRELSNIKKNAPDEYNDAVKEVGYEIDKGTTDDQIVAFLSDYLNESQIKRLKYLIKY